MSSSNINNHFFEGSYKHAWKRTIPPGLSEAEVDFIQEIANVKNEGRILDIMCGYGRHALEFGKRGVSVTAVDNLDEYIEEINFKANQASFPVKAIQGELQNVGIVGIYDATICMGNSFNFFNREEAALVLKKIAEHLKAGGIFILNSWTIAEISFRYFKEKDWHWAGEYKCVLDNQFHFNPCRIESEQTIIAPDGTVETIKGVDYIYSLDEMEQMFQTVGLRTTGLYSTPRKRKFNLGDSRIYIVAQKYKQ